MVVVLAVAAAGGVDIVGGGGGGGGSGPLSSAAAQVALLWLPPTNAAPRQLEPKWRPAVEDWASETQTYVFSYGFLETPVVACEKTTRL